MIGGISTRRLAEFQPEGWRNFNPKVGGVLTRRLAEFQPEGWRFASCIEENCRKRQKSSLTCTQASTTIVMHNLVEEN